MSTSGDCPPCTGGSYCATMGLVVPTGLCNGGYYCTTGATTATPTDGTTGDRCTIGHYCPAGTTVPVACQDGTYMPNTGSSECDNCTAGHYCLDGINPIDCPVGNYCPAGTGTVFQQCPIGTFSNSTGLASESDCTPCKGGKYCDSLAATTVAGDCNPGYFCTAGAESATPSGSYGTSGICPAGSFCLAATVYPDPCPQGTFSNTTGLTMSSQCTPCSFGKYCGSTGLTEPTGDCDAGFYCLSGASVPNNPTLDSTGGPCPVGHYCPVGTSYPPGCASGTYR